MITEQLDLLDTIATDRIHSKDRATVEAAIRADAAAHGGIVDPGRVRQALTNEWGLTVFPRLLSAVYGALARSGVLVHHGWTTNTDIKGRNSGKPQRLWRLA